MPTTRLRSARRSRPPQAPDGFRAARARAPGTRRRRRDRTAARAQPGSPPPRRPSSGRRGTGGRDGDDRSARAAAVADLPRCRREPRHGRQSHGVAARGGSEGLPARPLEPAAARREGTERRRSVQGGRDRWRDVHPHRARRLGAEPARRAARSRARRPRRRRGTRSPLLALPRRAARPAAAGGGDTGIDARADAHAGGDHVQGSSRPRRVQGRRRAAQSVPGRELDPAGRTRARRPAAEGARPAASARDHPGAAEHGRSAGAVPPRLRRHRRRHLPDRLPARRALRPAEQGHQRRRRRDPEDGPSRRREARLDDAPDRVERHRHLRAAGRTSCRASRPCTSCASWPTRRSSAAPAG